MVPTPLERRVFEALAVEERIAETRQAKVCLNGSGRQPSDAAQPNRLVTNASERRPRPRDLLDHTRYMPRVHVTHVRMYEHFERGHPQRERDGPIRSLLRV